MVHVLIRETHVTTEMTQPQTTLLMKTANVLDNPL